MKKYFTLGILALSLSVLGQQAGKAGELLKNEASASEMRSQQRTGNNSASNENERRVFVDPNGMRGQQKSSNHYPILATPKYFSEFLKEGTSQ